MKKALLVIDMQNVCVGENHSPFFKYDNSNLIENVNAVISGYEPKNVYYIMNIIEDNFMQNLFKKQCEKISIDIQPKLCYNSVILKRR